MDNDYVIEATSAKLLQEVQESRGTKPFSHDLLLIEDDNLCLFAGREILSRLTTGKIDTAKTAIEAAQKLRNNRYDLVVSDLCLAGCSALDLIGEAQTQSWSKNKNTPFIALTAYRDMDKHQEALAVGFKVVIAKPLTEEQARIFLENYLGPYSSKDTAQIIKRPSIDLKLGMERIGVYTEEKAIHALELLIASLPEDLVMLKNAETKQDSLSINQILHKLTGALNYSGTPALEKAVQDLREILQANETSAISKGIQNVQEQVKLLKEAYYDLLMQGA
ncbi:MAG: arcB 2 [Gammaproteobacteria bacterium]|jgi:two-component system sensor histidine kinase BarA|nr:arcB 2 [Gammaproteobacteria bacterium]